MNPQGHTSTSAQTHAWQDVAENGRPQADDSFAFAIASGASVREAAGSAGI